MIKDRGVIIMSAQPATNSATYYGHTWIIDGFKYKYVHYDEYYVETMDSNGRPIQNGERTLHKTYKEEYSYDHINWGWYGQNNGYFSSNVFNTKSAYSYDSSYNDINANYSTEVTYFVVK